MENNTNSEKPEVKKSFRRELLNNLILIGCVVLAVVLLERFVFVNATIPSQSMENTIMVGDRVFGNRLAYVNSSPKRYDIIIFRYPDDESQLFIKRVIGLPGDTIDIRDGEVYVNGSETPLTDSFCPQQGVTDAGNMEVPFTVPEGCYFVLGDNRLNSRDSRYWTNHFVTEDEIVAKAVFRYWPLNKMKVLGKDNDTYYDPDSQEVSGTTDGAAEEGASGGND
jgi:signal peptidase I